MLGPKAKLHTADGKPWEIYVHRTKPPGWRPIDSTYGGAAMAGIAADDGDPLGVLFAVPIWIWNEIVWPSIRAGIELGAAFIGSAGSDTRYVEAVDFSSLPPQSRLWVTRRADAKEVVEELAAALAAGANPVSVRATYLGQGPR